MSSPSKITVLGAGSWGTALAILLAKNGHDVLLWGRSETKINTMQAKGENSFFYLTVKMV